MLHNRYAEGIPPVSRIYSRLCLGPCIRIVRILDCRKENLRAGQVEHIKLFPLVTDPCALQLVPVKRLPAHHLIQFCSKKSACDLAALPLIVLCNAPADCIACALFTWADYQFFRGGVYKHLHVYHLFQFGNTSVVENDAVALDRKGRIELVGEELTAHHLVSLKRESCFQCDLGCFLPFFLA